jgi:hypothetical protein
VGAALALQLCGCGGSSSETPPPLEPDPARLRGDPARLDDPAKLESGSEPNLTAPIPALPGPSSPPARRGTPSNKSPSSSSTWGGGSSAPELAPEPR